MVSRKTILNYLASLENKTGLINKLNIKYSPVICPYEVLLSYAEPHSSILDIGCGLGQFFFTLIIFSLH